MSESSRERNTSDIRAPRLPSSHSFEPCRHEAEADPDPRHPSLGRVWLGSAQARGCGLRVHLPLQPTIGIKKKHHADSSLTSTRLKPTPNPAMPASRVKALARATRAPHERHTSNIRGPRIHSSRRQLRSHETEPDPDTRHARLGATARELGAGVRDLDPKVGEGTWDGCEGGGGVNGGSWWVRGGTGGAGGCVLSAGISRRRRRPRTAVGDRGGFMGGREGSDTGEEGHH